MTFPKILAAIFCILAESLAALAAPATTTPVENPVALSKGWTKGCDNRIAAAKGKPIEILFVGDSVTQNFDGYPMGSWKLVGGEVWAKHYAKNSLNLGVGSDGTEHILWRLAHQDIKDFSPKAVVVMAGLNDMQYSTEDIFAGLKAVVEKCRSLYPAAKIVVMSITPNKRDMTKTAGANKLLQAYADGKAVTFVDLTAQMPAQDKGWKGIGGDLVHLTQEGYEIWAASLDPVLGRLLGR